MNAEERQLIGEAKAGVILGLAAGDHNGGPQRLALRIVESIIDHRGRYNNADVLRRYASWVSPRTAEHRYNYSVLLDAPRPDPNTLLFPIPPLHQQEGVYPPSEEPDRAYDTGAAFNRVIHSVLRDKSLSWQVPVLTPGPSTPGSNPPTHQNNGSGNGGGNGGGAALLSGHPAAQSSQSQQDYDRAGALAVERKALDDKLLYSTLTIANRDAVEYNSAGVGAAHRAIVLCLTTQSTLRGVAIDAKAEAQLTHWNADAMNTAVVVAVLCRDLIDSSSFGQGLASRMHLALTRASNPSNGDVDTVLRKYAQAFALVRDSGGDNGGVMPPRIGTPSYRDGKADLVLDVALYFVLAAIVRGAGPERRIDQLPDPPQPITSSTGQGLPLHTGAEQAGCVSGLPPPPQVRSRQRGPAPLAEVSAQGPAPAPGPPPTSGQHGARAQYVTRPQEHRQRIFSDALLSSFEFAGAANYCPVLVGPIAGALLGGDAVSPELLAHHEFSRDWRHKARVMRAVELMKR